MRERLLTLLRRHGWNATSFQLLEPGFRYWFDGDDACVAYVDTGAAWVVAGSPVAAEERIGEVAARFVEAGRRAGRRVCFFAVERRMLDALALSSIPVGEQPWWDPRLWDGKLRSHRSLREQLRRTRAKGVVVRRLDAGEVPGLRGAIDALLRRWQRSRAMSPMAFLVALQPFDFPEERRYYVAEREGALLGLLVAVPVYARGGWFFEDLIRDPASPNGTAESLVDAAMRDVAADGAEFVTLGLAPLSGEARWMRLVRETMSGFYNFAGVRAFKAKLRPDGWDPIYLAYPRERRWVSALYDGLSAFAGGSAALFALRSIFRAPPIVLRGLVALLVPWIGLLATAKAAWFPSRGVQAAWVAFDGVVTAVLFALAHRWSRRVGVAAAAALTLDAILTAVEAAYYNVPRASGAGEWLVILAAVLAPSLAAAILWGGVLHRR